MGFWSDLLGVLGNTFRIGRGKAVFDASGLTAERTFTLPDESGTLSLGGGGGGATLFNDIGDAAGIGEVDNSTHTQTWDWSTADTSNPGGLICKLAGTPVFGFAFGVDGTYLNIEPTDFLVAAGSTVIIGAGSAVSINSDGFITLTPSGSLNLGGSSSTLAFFGHAGSALQALCPASGVVSDPPTQAEVEEIANKVNEVIQFLTNYGLAYCA